MLWLNTEIWVFKVFSFLVFGAFNTWLLWKLAFSPLKFYLVFCYLPECLYQIWYFLWSHSLTTLAVAKRVLEASFYSKYLQIFCKYFGLFCISDKLLMHVWIYIDCINLLVYLYALVISGHCGSINLLTNLVPIFIF